MIDCKQDGHEKNQRKYLCIYQQCNQQRLSCDICLEQNIHDHNQDQNKYLVLLDQFSNLVNACYIKNNITVDDKILENIIQNQIIIIDEAIDDQKIYNKQSLHILESQDLKFVFSNNKKLMVTWAQDEHLKMWHKYKIINKMVDPINLNIGIFSQDDQYFFVCYHNIIQIFDVQQNFKLLDMIQLNLDKDGASDVKDFEPFYVINNIKIITNNIVLVTIDETIFRVDFNSREITLKLTLVDIIRSLDYQNIKQVILSYSDVICIWDQLGNLILLNKGGVLEKITQFNCYFQSSIIANFIGDQDRIIAVNPNGVIIWFIDYNQRILVLDKIILTPTLIYVSQLNVQKNQINLIRQQDLLCLSLTDYQYQVKKHAVEIKQSLTEANYLNEIVFTRNLYKSNLQKLVTIRSSFNNI